MDAMPVEIDKNAEPAAVSANAGAPEASRSSRRLIEFMGDYSIEVSPHATLDVPRTAALLGPGRTVYVTSLPGREVSDNLTVSARLAKAGLRVVPHLAARRISSRAALAAFLSRARDEVGTDDLLLIAGDERRVHGPYDDSASVIESGLLGHFGIRRIGIAGYPGGNPAIDEDRLRAALARKAALIRAAGLEARIVTQFAFEPAPIVDFIRRVGSDGIGFPVHVGLAGLAHAGTLLKFARRCGVAASLRMLGTHGGALMNLLTVSTPGAALLALAAAADAPNGARPARIHFFPFGGVERTARWANAIARGEFDIDADGSGFAVRDGATER